MFLTCGLLSCGGGGGADKPSGPGPSLIPAPPPAGEVLYDDASSLRPLVAGAIYTYRGTDRASELSSPAIFTNTVVQAAASHNEVLESATDSFNEGADAAIALLHDGSVISRQNVDLTGSGAVQVMDLLELRSPVRLSDQYTVLERHLPGAVSDADGDGTPEAADLAAYRRVVGNEVVSLPNLPAMTALRVDYVTLVRLRLSADGRLGPVVQLVLSTWYARGIGIIQQRFVLPNGSELSHRIIEERLLSWDGITTGVGFNAAIVARTPAESEAPGFTLPGLKALVPEESGAVAVTDLPQAVGAAGTALSRLDSRGRVTLTRYFSGWTPEIRYTQFAAVAGQIAAVRYAAVVSHFQYRLTSFDASLQPRGDLSGLPFDLGPTHPDVGIVWVQGVASEGPRLWLLYTRSWTESHGGFIELILRAFDMDAQPLTPEYVLDVRDLKGFFGIARLDAHGGRVVATWTSSPGGGAIDLRYAVIEVPGADPVAGTIVEGVVKKSNPNLRAVAAGGRPGVVWPDRLERDFLGGSDDGRLRGVTFDEQQKPLRTTMGSADLEVLTTNWSLSHAAPALEVVGNRKWLVFPCEAYAYLWPEDPVQSHALQLAVMPASNAPLAQRASSAALYRRTSVMVEPQLISGRYVVMDDRVLIIGQANGMLATSVLWLH